MRKPGERPKKFRSAPLQISQLLADDTCYFLAADFDEADWREDAQAFVTSCGELGVPVALEISRSGNGAHAWIFFVGAISAQEARRLGAAIISHACARTRQLKLTSYDRLFPNQDTLPKGGFGNLIALPLQKKPRDQGCSVFVDKQFRPYPDQWGYLARREYPDPRASNRIAEAMAGKTDELSSARPERCWHHWWWRQKQTNGQDRHRGDAVIIAPGG